jgi:hypothetical protein
VYPKNQNFILSLDYGGHLCALIRADKDIETLEKDRNEPHEMTNPKAELMNVQFR